MAFWALSDVYSGDACEERVHGQRSLAERTAPRRRHDCDVWRWSVNSFVCFKSKWTEQHPFLILPILYYSSHASFLIFQIDILPFDLFFLILHRRWLCPQIRGTITSSQMLSPLQVWTLNLKSGPTSCTASQDKTVAVTTAEQVRGNSFSQKYLNNPHANKTKASGGVW